MKIPALLTCIALAILAGCQSDRSPPPVSSPPPAVEPVDRHDRLLQQRARAICTRQMPDQVEPAFSQCVAETLADLRAQSQF